MFARTHQEKNPLASALKDDIGIIDKETKGSIDTPSSNND